MFIGRFYCCLPPPNIFFEMNPFIYRSFLVPPWSLVLTILDLRRNSQIPPSIVKPVPIFMLTNKTRRRIKNKAMHINQCLPTAIIITSNRIRSVRPRQRAPFVLIYAQIIFFVYERNKSPRKRDLYCHLAPKSKRHEHCNDSCLWYSPMVYRLIRNIMLSSLKGGKNIKNSEDHTALDRRGCSKGQSLWDC